MANANCLLLLLTGNILTGLTCTFTNVIGVWFYAIMIAIFEISIAIRYGNVLAPAVIGVVSSILMISQLPPYAQWIPVAVLIVNIAAILYLMFVREE